jgi:hypothetical protein
VIAVLLKSILVFLLVILNNPGVLYLLTRMMVVG